MNRQVVDAPTIAPTPTTVQTAYAWPACPVFTVTQPAKIATRVQQVATPVPAMLISAMKTNATQPKVSYTTQTRSYVILAVASQIATYAARTLLARNVLQITQSNQMVHVRTSMHVPRVARTPPTPVQAIGVRKTGVAPIMNMSTPTALVDRLVVFHVAAKSLKVVEILYQIPFANPTCATPTALAVGAIALPAMSTIKVHNAHHAQRIALNAPTELMGQGGRILLVRANRTAAS